MLRSFIFVCLLLTVQCVDDKVKVFEHEHERSCTAHGKETIYDIGVIGMIRSKNFINLDDRQDRVLALEHWKKFHKSADYRHQTENGAWYLIIDGGCGQVYFDADQNEKEPQRLIRWQCIEIFGGYWDVDLGEDQIGNSQNYSLLCELPEEPHLCCL